jgi:hypothetical protein
MRQALMLLIASSVSTLAHAQEELVVNGDLEAEAPLAWGSTGMPGARLERESSGEDGNHALALHIEGTLDQTAHSWHQRIELAEGLRPKRLELRARTRAEGMHAAATAAIMVQSWDVNGRMRGLAWTDRTQHDTDWREVNCVFDVPEDCEFLRVLAYCVGGGDVWYDDFTLRASDAALRSSHDQPTFSAYERLVRDAASDIPWLFDADAARELARTSRKPILVYVRNIDADASLADAEASLAADSVPFTDDGYKKDVLMRAGPLSDPEVAELIRRRFVPLVLTYDLSLHGMGLNTNDPLQEVRLVSRDVVTPALFVLNRRGKLVHGVQRIGTLSASFVDQILRRSLELSRARAPKSDEPMQLYLGGDLEGALRLLGDRMDEAAAVLRARVHMRRAELEEAQRALETTVGPEAGVVRGRLFLARGDLELARAAFAQVTFDDPHAPAREEGAFWTAWTDMRLGHWEDAFAAFAELAGETHYGRKAAACILPQGPRLWLSETARRVDLGASLPVGTEGWSADDPLDLTRAITFLLQQQRSDGSFGGHDGAQGRGFWDAGVSAIAAQALLDWRNRVEPLLAERIDVALDRVCEYLDAWSLVPPSPGSAAFNQPYALLFLAEHGQVETSERLVASIAMMQQDDGNWTVYQSDRPASFNTALNVLALARARNLGLEIPEEVLQFGVRALDEMRTRRGYFPYSTKPGHEWMTTAHGSIARDALCEYALWVAGENNQSAIDTALDRFVKFADELRAPTKRLYDYFNSRGHGGYYYFFAFDNAVLAAGIASPAGRKKVLALAESSVLTCREFDGTWMDHALLGRAYGTAMALRILARTTDGLK